MVRELHVLDHLLLYQERVHLSLAHGLRSGGSHLLLLLLVLERGKHLGLSLRLSLLSHHCAARFCVLILWFLIDYFNLFFIFRLNNLVLFLLGFFLMMFLLNFLFL